MKKNEEQGLLRNRIITIFVATVAVVVALLVFMNVNSNRIISQNGEYLETSTGQTARRVNDLFDSSLRSVQMAASVYEESLASSQINPREAVSILNLTQFDDSFFITPDGTAYNRDDRTSSATDRYYFTEGMKGESGICFINNAIFDGQNIIAFFAPVNHGDSVIGVIVSAYQESTLTEFMTTSFSGEQTPTYLCKPDGEIIAKALPEDSDALFINEVFSNESLDGLTVEQVDRDIANGVSTSFTYHTDEGVGNTYMMKLASFDWVLVRSFPASITNRMVANANLAGMILVAGVLAAAALIMVVFMVQSRKKNKRLLLERQAATRIIDASTNLFSSMLSIDLVNKTYEYLKSSGMRDDLPAEGSYEQLRAFFEEAVEPGESGEPLAILDLQEMKRLLPKDVPFFQQEAHAAVGDRWFQIALLSVTRTAQGVPTQVLVAIQDITETKTAEIKSRNALEDAFKAAEHASQAKSDFLNSMSHDIRTPMNSIMGLTAIAGMHVDEPDRVRECLTNITSASRHLLGLINEVLDMAKIESGTIGLSEEAFELSETVESLITIINPQIAAKNQELKVNLVDIKHEHVIGDPTRLQQVFVNIMGNAIKFTPEGGESGLRITELPSRIPDSGCYEFIFSDTGCGMSPEFVKTVFDPFTRANDSRTTKVEGTGLGMAIVKSVVNMMNGDIEVESAEGEGTTFTVTVHLKLRDGATEDLSELEDMRVLVVDDDLIACEGACLLLDDMGMRSEFVMSGKEGIEAVVKAKREGNPYNAVILDWRMPEMSGLEAAKRIREVAVDQMPIIILSGYDWSIIEQEAREVGVDAFISKPLFRSRLVQVMKELISGEVKSISDEQVMLEELQFRGRRILLTEDNMMAATIAQELLELTDADVDHAENGKLAVDALLNHDPGHYDIVLMDIQMPVMNGYEAATAIREAAAERPDMGEIPIIALSADAFAEDVKRTRSVGMNDHMAKPLEIDTLVRMLKKWVK